VAGHLRRVRKVARPEAVVKRAQEYGITVPEKYMFVRPFGKGKRDGESN